MKLVQSIVIALLLGSAAFAGPTGPLKVVALGDSVTEGDGDDQQRGGYPGRLEQLLQAKHPGSKVKNFGHSGWTSEMVIQGYEGKQSSLKQALEQKPDLALVWIGSNDLWYLYEYADPKASDEKENADKFRARVETILSKLKAQKIEIAIALLDDQSHRPVAIKGQAFTGISKAELKSMSKQVAVYNQILKAAAKKHGATVVDLSADKLFGNPSNLADDGNHPNGSGYDQLAKSWLAGLHL